MERVAKADNKPHEQIITVYDLGDCTFNAAHGEIHSKNTDEYLHLEKKVAEVFHCLVKARGEVITRTEIFDSVWPKLIVSDDSLNRCISVLRKKLKQFNHNLSIKTHPKVGFHLVYCDTNIATNSSSPIKVESTQPLTQKNTTIKQKQATHVHITPSKGFIIILILVCILLTWQYISGISNTAKTSNLAPTLDASRIVIMPFELSKELTNSYPKLETNFRQLIANHPSLSTISINEVNKVTHMFAREIAQRFSARYIIRAIGFNEQARDLLQWQLIDGKSGDVMLDSHLNLALHSTQTNIRILAKEFIEKVIQTHLTQNSDAQMQASIESAEYLFLSQEGNAFNRPAINLLANAITNINPNSVDALKALAKLLTFEVWSMKKLSHPYSNLAINTLKKAINLAPLDAELYQLLSRIQMAKYQWFQARSTLEQAQQALAKQHQGATINLYELNHQTGQFSDDLLQHFQSLHQSSPLNIEYGLSLASIYMQMEKPQQALTVADSLVLNEYEWGETGALLGPAYIRFGDEQKGKQLFFSGYEKLGVPKSYIDVLYQGIKYPEYQIQASQFLTQAADDGMFEHTVLLYMYAELADIDNYFALAFTLADNHQYRLLSAMRAHTDKIRRHPQFISLMEKIGLVDYWSSYGLPKFCQQGVQIHCS